jgi:hypothetical protein
MRIRQRQPAAIARRTARGFANRARRGFAVCAGAAVIGGWLALAAVPALSQTPPAAGEYDVKAAFLVNFGGFVHWPDSVFADEHAPFVICIYGDNPFGAAFDPFRERTVGGRPLAVRAAASPAPAPKDCQILFVSGSERARLPAILRELERSAVLTVSDVEDFAHGGGVIQLLTRDKKIRFAVNRAAADAAGLKIDARLLRLAEPTAGAFVEHEQ